MEKDPFDFLSVKNTFPWEEDKIKDEIIPGVPDPLSGYKAALRKAEEEEKKKKEIARREDEEFMDDMLVFGKLL